MNDDKYVLKGAPLERVVDMSLGELLLMTLKLHETNTILIDASTNEELGANIILAKSIQIAKWLQTQGIGPGTYVSINCENRIEFPVIAVGCFLIGATISPLNPDYTATELKHVLNLSKPKVIFCSGKTLNKMVSVLTDNGFIERLVAIDPTKHFSNSKVINYNDIVQGVTKIDETFKTPTVNPLETVATILCSSGTTGMPKGVMCTHDNMTTYIDIARMTFPEIIDNDEVADAIIGLTPFFHSFGFMLMFLNLLRGKQMVIIRRFQLKHFLESIVRYKVTRLIVPPPVLLILVKHPLTKQYDLSSLKEVRSGAASLAVGLEKELKLRLKVKKVSQAYGMTETTLGVLLKPDNSPLEKLGSVGKIVPGMMVKVIDELGVSQGPNVEGELCFKGPLIVKGYIGDPKATADTIDSDGWLHTGDIGYYDEDGYFYIVDRIKELIKYKAFQVAPAELEALLLNHPSIIDAAVIGLPDDAAGELPLAYVVKRSGKNITEEEVKKHVSDSLSPQKHLRGGVIFVDQIPKNPTGKILRRVLRKRAIESLKVKSKL